jgi:hypothetical protein
MTARRPIGSREDSLRTPIHSDELLWVGWESYMTPSRAEWTKIPPETGGCSYFLTEKSPKTSFLKKP